MKIEIELESKEDNFTIILDPKDNNSIESNQISLEIIFEENSCREADYIPKNAKSTQGEVNLLNYFCYI